jgi:hypothetical protein
VSEQTAPPATDEVPAQPRSTRGRKTAGDMVRSLAVVLVLVAVIVAFNVAQQPDQMVQRVDYPAALSLARSQASYDVLAPDPVPAGWRVSSARTERAGGGVAWHVGFVTSSEEYAALEQTDGARRTFVDRFAGGARPDGQVDVGGVRWHRLAGGSPEERALVRDSGGVTTVLAGSASWDDLERLASALRSQPPE